MLLANASQIRRSDQIQIEEKDYPGILLMENAGRLSAEKICELFPSQKDYWILCGPGNNGGDGLVIARYLHQWGKRITVILSHDAGRYEGDAKINYDILVHLPVPILAYDANWLRKTYHDQVDRPVFIDALLGTGITSKLRPPISNILDVCKELDPRVIAIDLPSGLDASSGALSNEPLIAKYTLTFQLPKVCQFVFPAAKTCGQTIVLDIDIWPEVVHELGIIRVLMDKNWFKQAYGPRDIDDHKGSLGHVLVIGGSRHMGGAVAMTAFAAMKAGAGLCTVFTHPDCVATVMTLCPECMCIAMPSIEGDYLDENLVEACISLLSGKSAVCLGPGLGNSEATTGFVSKIFPHIHIPLVLDADGLNILSQNPSLWDQLPNETVLTPHPGEMRRLDKSFDVLSHRLELAEHFAKEKNCTLVLKGAGTIIANSDGNTWVNTTGNPGMATGGSGDVLAGMVSALLARGYEPAKSAAMAVFIHGMAGDLMADVHGQDAVVATDIAKYIGKAIKLSLKG